MGSIYSVYVVAGTIKPHQDMQKQKILHDSHMQVQFTMSGYTRYPWQNVGCFLSLSTARSTEFNIDRIVNHCDFFHANSRLHV
jgi:hypothetical protein